MNLLSVVLCRCPDLAICTDLSTLMWTCYRQPSVIFGENLRTVGRQMRLQAQVISVWE